MTTGKRRRLPGLNVKPGSVRRAREEARLSLAGMARDDLSRTAIFLVETGKSKPTLPTLELIAERTGKSLDYFLEDVAATPRLDVTEIEQELAAENMDRVLELTEALLTIPQTRAELAQLRFYRGQALIRRADVEGAEPLLREAREYYESVGNSLMALECSSWEIHIPYLREDPAALAIAEAVLARCRALARVPIQTEVRIVARIAGIHAHNRDWQAAITRYEEAVQLLGPVRDLHRLALTYTDLGAAYRETGQADIAARYLQKSVALNEVVNDRRSLAMAENNLALALMNLSDHASAQSHLDRAIEIYEEVGVERGKGHVLLSLCELKLKLGSLEAADDSARRALEVAARVGERATEAEAHQWIGRVAAARGDALTTDREFQAAIALLQQMGLAERLIRAHAAYAELLEERGDLAAANHHLKEVVASSRPDLANASDRADRTSRRLA